MTELVATIVSDSIHEPAIIKSINLNYKIK